MSVQPRQLGSSLVKPEEVNDVSASGLVVGGTFSCQFKRMTTTALLHMD